jgi:hypothetical protein
MNLKCIFGFHKWEYKLENAEFIPATKSITPIGIAAKNKIFPTNTRFCNSCFKKQINVLGKWEKYKLSTEQKRDKKIKELGV